MYVNKINRKWGNETVSHQRMSATRGPVHETYVWGQETIGVLSGFTGEIPFLIEIQEQQQPT